MVPQWDTPCLVVDLDVMEKNINKMAELAKTKGIKLRPHIKTHKSPIIALKQLAAGACGITVAKLGEAEVMRKYGICDILIAYPIVGEKKLNRLEVLAKDTNVIVALDSVEVAKGISDVGKRVGKKIPVYVEVDTGLGRCGKTYGEETVHLINELLNFSHIEIRGLMTHAGHSYKTNDITQLKEISRKEGEFLVNTKQLVLEKLGFEIQEVSVGSTPTALIGCQVEGVTEMRPGTYVFNDATIVALGLAGIEDCALTIYATVVSRPSKERAIIDAGSKTLSSDKSILNRGYGILKNNMNVYVTWLTEEHGIIELPPDFDLKIGDVVEIIPNHVCPTVNLTDELIGIKDGRITEIFRVEARGKNR